MRYPKGSIDATSEQDRKLLEQVLRSQFIAHGQLWEFLRDRCIEMNRRSYCWRVKRLVGHGLLLQHEVRSITRENVYSVAPHGLIALQSGETFYADNPLSVEKNEQEPHIAHALMLNSVHLRLLRFGLLREWVWEREVRARNEFTMDGFRKDYDAVVTLEWEGRRMRFGLEYERWAKGERRYAEVATQLQREAKVAQFLYLVSGENLRKYLMQCFHHRISKPIYIGLVEDLLSANPAMMSLIDGAGWEVTTLGTLCSKKGVAGTASHCLDIGVT